MNRIFISYRRADSHLVAGRMAQFLDGVHGIDEVFLDVDGIAPGDDFADKIRDTLEKTTCCFVLIGPRWSGRSEEGGEPRLFSPDDFVRLECQLALASGKRVVPVLLDGTSPPKASELPRALKRLQRLNAFELRTSRFDEDMDDLLDVLFGRKRVRGSRWRHRGLTPLGIVARMAAGLAAAATLVFVVAVANGLISSCNLACRMQHVFGLDDTRAYGSMLSVIALVLLAGALLPFLSKLTSRR